jgi:hypothetical protein
LRTARRDGERGAPVAAVAAAASVGVVAGGPSLSPLRRSLRKKPAAAEAAAAATFNVDVGVDADADADAAVLLLEGDRERRRASLFDFFFFVVSRLPAEVEGGGG